ELERIAREDFGLEGEWAVLPSERDHNFRIMPPSGGFVTFKVANADEPPDIVDCETAALQHIAHTDPTLPVPRVVLTRTGKPSIAICDASGRSHIVHVLSHLPGEIIGERRLTTAQLEATGSLVSRLGKALRGFIHPAPAARELLWDNRLAPKLLDHAHLISDPVDRRLVIDALEGFRDEVCPRLAMLRAQ